MPEKTNIAYESCYIKKMHEKVIASKMKTNRCLEKKVYNSIGLGWVGLGWVYSLVSGFLSSGARQGKEALSIYFWWVGLGSKI